MLPNRISKKYALLLASLLFYAYWDYRFVTLLIGSIGFNFYIAQQIAKTVRKKEWLLISVFANIGVLSFFKYYDFFVTSFVDIATPFGAAVDDLHLHLILPIGISFYTFQALSYTIDMYKNKIPPVTNWLDFALYVSFFPQLVAGPIERAEDMLPQFETGLFPSKHQLKEGFYLIAIGLFQKVMIGDACGRLVDAIFYDLEKYTSFEICSAVILFSFQIYADFAGYSNMARGVAKLVGIELSVNFRQPYFSQTIAEFWSRWHISLSTWLRDYLYVPLGGNRQGTLITYRNLFLVMLLGGLWHGAGFNFLIWGAYHGVLLIIAKHVKGFKLPGIIAVGMTFFLVVLGWFIFRINTLDQLAVCINKITHFESGAFYVRFIKMIATFGLVLFIIDYAQIKYKNQAFLTQITNQYVALGMAFSMLVISFLFMLLHKPLPFLYFQF